ncbi:hypothetical protein Peur_034400 [Populus x canadensis]
MSIQVLILLAESPIYGQIFRLFLCLYTVNRSSLPMLKKEQEQFPSCSMLNIKLQMTWPVRN